MTITFGLNSNNDIYLGADGNLVVLTGQNAVAGACETISRSRLGEMIYTSTQGMPYLQAVFIGVPNLRLWQAYLSNSLQNVNGVIKVNDIQLINENNTLNYTATIESQYGVTEING